MKEIKLTIDGKEARLTDEQLKMLGIATRNNPFDRTSNPCGEYFYTDAFGSVGVGSEEYSDVWKQLGNTANYFNDKNFANQVALHQLLYRKLLKYAYDNEFEDTAEWDGTNLHWAIRYNSYRNEFRLYYQDGYKAHEVYFSSEEGAKRAIKEVVEPFMKEHPEFVW
jgi:hypothetical protein